MLIVDEYHGRRDVLPGLPHWPSHSLVVGPVLQPGTQKLAATFGSSKKDQRRAAPDYSLLISVVLWAS